MNIYGSPLSPFVARVMMTCDYKKLSYDLIMPEGGLKTAEYLSLNPFGKMPAIKDGRHVLYESGVIIDYLEDKYPQKRIIPKSATAAGKSRLIATICDLYVQPPTLILFRQIIGRSSKDRAEAKSALQDLNKGLDVLDQYINPGPCASGKRFTIADCYALPSLLFASSVTPRFGLKNPYKDYLNVKKFWATIKKHPSAISQYKIMKKIMEARLQTL